MSMIRRLLDASTAHLPQQLCQQLNTLDGVLAHATDHGWLLWVPTDPDTHAADHPDLPGEVLTLQRYARSCGCDYVLLDSDADQISDLPTWDW